MQVPEWTTDLFSNLENFKNTVEGDRSQWDTLFLNKTAVLGVVQVTAKIDTGTDVQKAKGQKRASVVDNGSSPVKFTIRIEMQPGEITAFARDIVPLVRPKTKTTGQPRLKIVHPEAALWGVGLVKVTNVTSAPPTSGGTKIITLDVIEDVPPAPNKPNNNTVPKAQPKSAEERVGEVAENQRENAKVTEQINRDNPTQ